MRTCGIDLAVQAAGTAICVVDWKLACAEVRFVDGGENEALLEVLTDPTVDVIGIDVPFGWPRGFTEAVATYADRRDWPGAGGDFYRDYAGLRLRRTDHRAKEIAAALGVKGVNPMSVSADRLGAAAMRAAWLLTNAAASGVEVDRSGVTGKVVETYPAGAVRMWVLPFAGYRSERDRAAVHRNLDVVQQEAGWRIASNRPPRTHHELDALLCALVARAARTTSDGTPLTIGPDPRDLDLAVEEGWIHLPRPRTLPQLVEKAEPGPSIERGRLPMGAAPCCLPTTSHWSTKNAVTRSGASGARSPCAADARPSVRVVVSRAAYEDGAGGTAL